MEIVIALVVFFVLCLVWMFWSDSGGRRLREWDRGYVTGVAVGQDLLDE